MGEVKSKQTDGRRFAIGLVCWLLSSVGVMMSLMMVVSTSILAVVADPMLALRSATFYLGLASAFTWTALGVMTKAWVEDQDVFWFWPIAGALTGVVCAVVFVHFALIFFPCALLGIYLCFFHLSGGTASLAVEARKKG